MKRIIVLGNWKAHKNRNDVVAWIASFKKIGTQAPAHVEVILCPSYTHIELFIQAGLVLKLGAQDISAFPDGAYTGEVTGNMLLPEVTYVLIGHSERRRYCGETDETVAQKVHQALTAGITPIVCVSETEQAQALSGFIPDFAQKGMLLYEPLFAIGSGQPESPVEANSKAVELQKVLSHVPVIYGGSVDQENVHQYAIQPALAGIGAGGASLDPIVFSQLITASSEIKDN